MFHPTTFGKYFLTRRLAVGGMAEVFGAKLYGADGFEKDLVIKQILPQYANDPEFVQSFVAEAKIAVSLTHANIVSIYELGRVDGTYFIAMELVDGQDIFALLDAARRHDDPLDPGLALLMVEEVARGLDYAHRKLGPDGLPLGLVHRDLNPRNVLVSREGDVKILDFGIAKTASKSAAMPRTRQGVVKGTTGYMSPEQATGQEIDHRTDLYQAGLLLHECLTGRALFWRPEDHITRDLMRKHQVPPPSTKVPGLPPELDDLVLTALRIRPEQRFQTAAELVSAVARVRAIRYPAANHLVLGEWVTRVLERDRAAARAIEEEIPETADFSEVISHAIEQSISGRVETIATRAPSNVFIPPKRPTTGSQPLAAHAITGDLVPLEPGTPAPVAPAAVLAGKPITNDFPDLSTRAASSSGGRAWSGANLGPAPSELSLSTDLLLEGPDSNLHELEEDDSLVGALLPKKRWKLVVSAVLAILAAAAAGTWLLSTPAAAPTPDTDVGLSRRPDEPMEGAEAMREPPPLLEGAEPARRRASAPVEAGTRAPGRVNIGSTPCAAKIRIDGRGLRQPTPALRHELEPGRHRIMIEGSGCAAAHAPGTLEAKEPRVYGSFVLEPGGHLKIMADLVRGELHVTPLEP